jgi:cell wall-associated NlpC family hydrolase
MGAVRTTWTRVSSRILSLTRAGRAALACTAMPLLILGLSAVVPSGTALAQPLPAQPVTQATTAARLGSALRYTAAQLAVLHALHLHHLAHMAHLRALAAQARAARMASASSGHTTQAPVLQQSSSGISYSPPLSGHYGCSALEQLWVAAGGSSGAAVMAADIATAESGGDPSAVSPTNDYGLWQINGSWGMAMASFNPMTNAHSAITISHDGSNWSPWTTYTSGRYQGSGCGSYVTTSAIRPVPHPAPVSGSLEYRAMKEALTRVGDPYVWGAAGPGAFDCSGLVAWSYAQEGRYEPHFTGDLWNEGYHVSSSELVPGDLVFFYSGHSHVGIYIGGGQMVDAPHTGTDVKVQPVDWSNYSGAVRIP